MSLQPESNNPNLEYNSVFQEVSKFLDSLVVFQILPELKEEFIRNLELRTYKSEGVLLNEGDPVDKIVIVMNGAIRFTLNSVRNFETTDVGKIGKGEIFGINEFLAKDECPVNLNCQKGSRILIFSGAHFKKLIAKLPGAEIESEL